MRIIEYAKAHPVATGAIVIIGGIIFIMIVRGGSGSNAATVSGPSEAEIIAGANLEAARIQAQAATGAAQIGANVQMNSDNKAAEVAMRQIELTGKSEMAWIKAQRALGKLQIMGETRAIEASIRGEQQRFNSIIGSLGSLKKKNRDNVLHSLIIGNPGYRDSNTAGIIGAIGYSAGQIGRALVPFL
jgi:hypothetical protein